MSNGPRTACHTPFAIVCALVVVSVLLALSDFRVWDAGTTFDRLDTGDRVSPIPTPDPWAPSEQHRKGRQSAIIVQVDSRPLTSNFSDSSQFHSLTAAINYLYAKRHGYECEYEDTR